MEWRWKIFSGGFYGFDESIEWVTCEFSFDTNRIPNSITHFGGSFTCFSPVSVLEIEIQTVVIHRRLLGFFGYSTVQVFYGLSLIRFMQSDDKHLNAFTYEHGTHYIKS